MNQNKVIYLERIQTPLGEMVACSFSEKLCLLDFSDEKTLDKDLKDIKKALKAEIVSERCNCLKELKRELTEYFNGDLKKFTIPLLMIGTDFQKKVWNSLLQIPYGSKWSYQQQSEFLNNPKAIRAVAQANGANKIAIVIPCHRVIGKNGKLVGYSGGVARKEYLLKLETKKK